jgi:predicted RNA-binding protein Jag
MSPKSKKTKLQYVQVYFKSIIVLFALLFINQCASKDSNHFLFWKNYFSIQNELRNKYGKTGEFEILYGKLNSKSESKLIKKEDSLLLGIGVEQVDNKIEFQFNETLRASDFFHTISIYKKSEYNNRKTYLVTRKTKLIQSPIYTIKDFLSWVIEFNNSIRMPAGDKVYTNSKLYHFICAYFDCSASNENETYTFNFKLNRKINDFDQNYYKRLEKLLEHTQFTAKIYFDTKQNNQIEINNHNKSFQFKISKLEKIPNKIQIKTDIVFNYTGLKLEIKNLTHNINILISNNKVFFDGSFESLPEHKVSGRLLYIFSPTIVDVFIPGNMEDYLHDALYLMTKGGSNHKGSIFNLDARISKNKMDVDFYSETEIFSDPLLFFSSNNSDAPKISSSNNFMRELENKIVEEMTYK